MHWQQTSYYMYKMYNGKNDNSKQKLSEIIIFGHLFAFLTEIANFMCACLKCFEIKELNVLVESDMFLRLKRQQFTILNDTKYTCLLLPNLTLKIIMMSLVLSGKKSTKVPNFF